MAKKGFLLNAKVCGNCLTPEGLAPKLSACSRCGLVVYCSRDCQRAHWKSNHKQNCVAKADRVPQRQQPLSTQVNDASSAVLAGEKCAICQDLLTNASSACALPCKHVFHGTCVADLRKFGVEHACPLCRTSLSPGSEESFVEATRRYTVIRRLVKRGEASWSDLPASAQREVDAAVNGWRAAADEGFVSAQCNLGLVFEHGLGVLQSHEAAAQWYRKAADQGHMVAQCRLAQVLSADRGTAHAEVE